MMGHGLLLIWFFIVATHLSMEKKKNLFEYYFDSVRTESEKLPDRPKQVEYDLLMCGPLHAIMGP